MATRRKKKVTKKTPSKKPPSKKVAPRAYTMDQCIIFRCTAQEKNLIESSAAANNEGVSEYIRRKTIQIKVKK